MNKEKNIVLGGCGLVAVLAALATAPSVAGAAAYPFGHVDNTPLTGYYGEEDHAIGWLKVLYYWPESTEDQFKSVYWGNAVGGGDVLYYGDSNSFFYTATFSPSVDGVYGWLTLIHEQPVNWGTTYRHTYTSVYY